jgi:hypothetical protein
MVAVDPDSRVSRKQAKSFLASVQYEAQSMAG